MRRVNIADPEFRYDPDEDPEGFKAGMFRPGPDLGAKDTGMSIYELPPGQAICPCDKIAVWTGIRDEDLMVRRSSGVEYYEGETG